MDGKMSIPSNHRPSAFRALRLCLLLAALVGGCISSVYAQINVTNQQPVANPAAGNAMSDPSGIVISGANGELRITGAGIYTFGNNAAQLITLNGGNPSNGAFRTQGVNATVVNPFLVLANSAIFVQGGSSVLTLTGPISGSGTLEKRGGGVLDLTTSNPLAGGISITNGELRLSHLDAVSSASSVLVESSDSTLQLNLTGTNTWQLGTGSIILSNGGTLRQFSGTEDDIAVITQTIQLSGSGGRINAPGDSRIYAQGDITGGNLSKRGGGELRFTGTPKTYTGATEVRNGRLRIDTSGIPTDTSAINLVTDGGDSGNLRFGQAGTRTYSLGAGGNAPINITGIANSIEHTDLGHTTLTNPVSITGTGNFRSREDGALFEFSGPITGGGTLNINQGTGGNPVQSGTIFLSGDASAFAGNVNVLQSTLRLGENTTLGANAFNLQSGATLSFDIASPLQLGTVSATTATLAAGSIIATQFSTGPAGGVSTYDLIQTSGGVTDNGATVQSTGLMQLSLDTSDPNLLKLVANVDYAGFGVFGFNGIQAAVADYLNNAAASPSLSLLRGQALNSTTDAEIAAFYEAVAGEEYGGMMDTALFHGQEQLRSITRYAPHLQNRFGLRDSLGVRPLDGRQDSSQAGTDWNLFSDLRIQRGSQARTAELGGFDSSGQAFIFGADRVFSDGFAGGIFSSYEHTRTHFDLGRGWADADTLAVGAMGSLLLPKGNITAGIQYLHHSFDMERYSPLGTARSRPEGDQLGLILQGATTLRKGGLDITPTTFLQYNRLAINGFAESGAPISQVFNDMTADSLQGGIGVRVGYTIPGQGFSLRPEVFAEYRQEFLDGSRDIRSGLLDSSGSLGITTPGRSSGYAVVGGGLHAAFSNHASAFVQYEAQLIDTDTITYGIYGGFRWNFGDHLLDNPSLAFADSPRPYRDTLRGTPLGDALDFINLRALVMLQYDHAETASAGGTTPDPDDPADTDFWFARRIRLSADRDLGWGFNLGGAFQFTEELNSSDNAVRLFEANLGWDLFEPFSLYAGLDKVPLGWEETTGSARLKTIERSVATRALGRLGGDQIGRSHWRVAAKGTFSELYSNPSGPVNRYDFHYEFAMANPREAVNAPWSDDLGGLGERWPDPSCYFRIHNELRTDIGTFDFGADFADIPTFRARSGDGITGATAFSPFLNYHHGWFNFTATGAFAEYDRDLANGGQHRKANGFTLTPSLFITPQVELVGMYSRFDTDGDE